MLKVLEGFSCKQDAGLLGGGVGDGLGDDVRLGGRGEARKPLGKVEATNGNVALHKRGPGHGHWVTRHAAVRHQCAASAAGEQ